MAMSVYLIAYELREENTDSEELADRIRAFAVFMRCFKSTWLILTDWTAEAVRDHLASYFDSGDSLLVIKVSGERASLNQPKEWFDWGKEVLDRFVPE